MRVAMFTVGPAMLVQELEAGSRAKLQALKDEATFSKLTTATW
jgi:hypothetical protein